MLLLVRAYGVGAGTYTGIEAVSNGRPILREPRDVTGRRTMIYMGVSLAVAMVSAAALLFVAAQAGFLDGPRVLANMALDRWVPSRFAMMSDRFVTQNGIVLMGAASWLVLLAAHGAAGLHVVLYSIHVFITFSRGGH